MVNVALDLLQIREKEEVLMKGKTNGYATNKGGFIKAPKTLTKGEPKPVVTKGEKDLRVGKK